FFSSRRRHTRFSRDWSSDVCSSDLGQGRQVIRNLHVGGGGIHGIMPGNHLQHVGGVLHTLRQRSDLIQRRGKGDETEAGNAPVEIGRASCREEGRQRGAQYTVKRST